MKQIKTWLKQLPEPIKSRAMAYEDKSWFVLQINLASAVGSAFVWLHSKEGYHYWQLVSMGEFERAEQLLKEDAK
jgi:hypothetical protein